MTAAGGERKSVATYAGHAAFADITWAERLFRQLDQMGRQLDAAHLPRELVPKDAENALTIYSVFGLATIWVLKWIVESRLHGRARVRSNLPIVLTPHYEDIEWKPDQYYGRPERHGKLK